MTDKIDKKDKLLVIVESPSKVKTISGILKNAGYSRAVVISSVGHIMVLKDGGPAYNSGIYPKQRFKMNLAVSDDKKKVVASIIESAEKADKILVATDDDREGSLISWSLIKFCSLPKEKCYRAVFHEITPRAVIHAIENPVAFNDNLVDAGLARLMTDKLLGFSLSPLAKKYIGAKSVGRCQSVGLKLVSEREKEIQDFIPEMYFDLYLNFVKNNKMFKAKYCGYKEEVVDKLTKQADVDAIIGNCRNSEFIVENVKSTIHKESPKPPFCTATFQQEAATRLGLKVKDAMSYAQKLFESGKITYHRTDSTEFATDFISELKVFITNTYGADKYIGPRRAKKKTTDQNGHEALRVTDLRRTPEIFATQSSNTLLAKVYKLIWQRTVAAAMPNASISETVYTISCNEHKFKLGIKELTDIGYKSIYNYDDSKSLCSKEIFTVGEVLEKTELDTLKKFTTPPSRFSEASLVKELQQLEIGRPSTFATIVETVLSPTRGYATLEEKLIKPTDRGMQLADYCDRSFPTLINFKYTKEMEESLDKIASGELALLDYMEAFYNNLQEIVSNIKETGVAPELPEKTCPECGKKLIVRRSRFGKLFYGCDYPKCRYTESL